MNSTQNLYVKTLSLAGKKRKGAHGSFVQLKHRGNQSSSRTSISTSLKKLQTKTFRQGRAFIYPDSDIYSRLNGFTLTEVLAVVAIIGVLSAIALPNYINQSHRARQSEAAASLTQLQNAIVAFADENGVYPTSWKDLNEVAAIMTPSGATTQNNFGKLTLASSGCESTNQNNCYTVETIHSPQDSLYTLSAIPVDASRKKFNIVACLDLISGSSDFIKGSHAGAADIATLSCRG